MEGLDRRYIQRIGKGTANPGVEVLERLKSVLDTGWAGLLEDGGV